MPEEPIERGDLLIKRDGSSSLLLRVIAVEGDGTLTGTDVTSDGNVHGVRDEPVGAYRLATGAERQAAAEEHLLPPD